MKNLDIRIIVSDSGLKYTDIAEEMGVSRVWLSKLMRTTLTPENRDRILTAIKRLRGNDDE